MKNRYLLVGALLGLAVGGCQEPDQVVSLTPPGLRVDRTPEEEKGFNGPQALGEQAAAPNAGPVSKPASSDPNLVDGVRKTIQSVLPPKEDK